MWAFTQVSTIAKHSRILSTDYSVTQLLVQTKLGLTGLYPDNLETLRYLQYLLDQASTEVNKSIQVRFLLAQAVLGLVFSCVDLIFLALSQVSAFPQLYGRKWVLSQ